MGGGRPYRPQRLLALCVVLCGVAAARPPPSPHLFLTTLACLNHFDAEFLVDKRRFRALKPKVLAYLISRGKHASETAPAGAAVPPPAASMATGTLFPRGCGGGDCVHPRDAVFACCLSRLGGSGPASPFAPAPPLPADKGAVPPGQGGQSVTVDAASPPRPAPEPLTCLATPSPAAEPSPVSSPQLLSPGGTSRTMLEPVRRPIRVGKGTCAVRWAAASVRTHLLWLHHSNRLTPLPPVQSSKPPCPPPCAKTSAKSAIR